MILKNKKIFLFVLFVLIIKLILLPFSHTDDADAVSRIFLSKEWLANPHWIKTDVWGPFHYYLNALFLAFWENQILSPKLGNILISCLTLFPFYFFVKREFSQRGALIITGLFAFSPIIFRTSFMALSNTPFLLFFILMLNFLSLGIKKGQLKYFIYAGISITIAAGFRYESWLIMAIFGVLLMLYKRLKESLTFSAFALIFPIIWMISNWMETGDIFYSINGNFRWTHEIMGVNEGIIWKEYVKRILFFPYSVTVLIGIPIAIYAGWKMLLVFKHKDKNLLFWAVPYLIVIGFMMFNSYRGNLLNHHRFTGTLIVLLLPFFGFYLKEISRNKILISIFLGVLTIVISYFGNESGKSFFPRITDNFSTKIIKKIKENKKEKSVLIIDFIDWKSTYFIALQSKYESKDLIIVEGAKHSQLPTENINKQIKNHTTGVVVLKKNSALSKLIKENKTIVLSQKLYENDEIEVFVMTNLKL